MSFRLRACHFISVLMVAMASGENNNSSVGNQADIPFRCNASQKWKNMVLHGKKIQDACIKNDYYAIDAPGDKKNTKVFIYAQDIKVVNVDELKKTMTIDLTASAMWQDDRIMVNYHENRSYIDLNPLSKDSMPELWTPYVYVSIDNMKIRRYILDPITMQIGFVHIKFMEDFAGISNIFPTNSSLIWSDIAWSLTVSCSYDFSSFPFDKNICPFRMMFWDMDIIWQLETNSMWQLNKNSEPFNEPVEQHSDGFGIQMTLVPPQKTSGTDNHYQTSIGLDIAIKRLASKYIFQYYLPCCAIVATASFSFLIPFSAIPGRVALLVTQFLTLTSIFINVLVRIKTFLRIGTIMEAFLTKLTKIH